MEPGLYDCFGRAICPKMFSSAGPVSLMIGAERSKAGPADDLSRRPAALGKAATVRALSPVHFAVAPRDVYDTCACAVVSTIAVTVDDRGGHGLHGV